MATYKIGRAEGNHIVLTDKSISRQHAQLEELGAGRFRIKDLGSTSGTQMMSGSEWVDVTDNEVRHDTPIRLGAYETTPMDLLRSLDMTVVKPKVEAPPMPPPPVAGAPPRPSPPPAAPPPPPRAAAPLRPPSPAPSGPRPAAGGGLGDRKMLLILGGGLAAFLLLAVLVIVIVLVSDGDSRIAVSPPAPAPDTQRQPPPEPAPRQPPADPAPRQPPGQPEPRPAARESAQEQRFTQECTQRWGVSADGCQCLLRAGKPILQAADYDDAIAVLAAIFARNQDQIRQKVQSIVAQRGQEAAQRIVQAIQAMERDCKDVR